MKLFCLNHENTGQIADNFLLYTVQKGSVYFWPLATSFNKVHLFLFMLKTTTHRPSSSHSEKRDPNAYLGWEQDHMLRNSATDDSKLPANKHTEWINQQGRIAATRVHKKNQPTWKNSSEKYIKCIDQPGRIAVTQVHKMNWSTRRNSSDTSTQNKSIRRNRRVSDTST